MTKFVAESTDAGQSGITYASGNNITVAISGIIVVIFDFVTDKTSIDRATGSRRYPLRMRQ